MLVVLPTGCGKTLLFFLYAYKNSTVKNVVIVPTISLQVDLIRRARGHCITAINDPSTGANYSLLIVTPEAAITNTFRDAITHLHCLKQLGKNFIDEAHLFS